MSNISDWVRREDGGEELLEEEKTAFQEMLQYVSSGAVARGVCIPINNAMVQVDPTSNPRYVVLPQQIGTGAESDVYLAYDKDRSLLCALKVAQDDPRSKVLEYWTEGRIALMDGVVCSCTCGEKGRY